MVAVDKDDSRKASFGEMARLSEEGKFDWGELAWCGSDDRQSGWGNLSSPFLSLSLLAGRGLRGGVSPQAGRMRTCLTVREA